MPVTLPVPVTGLPNPVSSCSVADLVCLSQVALAAPSKPTPSGPGTLLSVESQRTHQERGLYFNFRLDAPLPVLASNTFFAGSEVVLENHGDLFMPHQDLYLDTKLNDDFKLSLVVPVWKKISFSPSVELFFFMNQVSRNFYYSCSTTMSLNYSFEWHPGLGWMRAMLYSNPVPALPTLPTK